jgi:hypothetical protein
MPRLTSRGNCPCILEGILSTNPYRVHFSPSRSKIQYKRSLPLNKLAIDWDFIPKEKLSMKRVINLEVKNITKSSLAYERVFVDYLLRGKWTNILDFEPWRWSALTMGCVDKNARAILFYFCWSWVGQAKIYVRVKKNFEYNGVMAWQSRAHAVSMSSRSHPSKWC